MYKKAWCTCKVVFFANLNLLLYFAVLVAVAVVFAYLSSLLGGEG